MSKRLLLLGASGLIGSDLLTMARAEGWQLAAPSHAELDIGDREKVMTWARQFSPDVILNAAGYTDVDGAESHPVLNSRANDLGAANLACAAACSGAMLVQLSSDYVFDGASSQPYQEDALPHPINAYGRAKLAGEQAVQSTVARHLIIRTSWVFGRNGRNFVRTICRLNEQHRRLRVVADQRGGPTWSRDIAAALLKMVRVALAPDFAAWGIYHYSGGPSTTWFGLADAIGEILSRSGRAVAELVPVSSEEYGAAAVRPANSCLDNRKMQRVFAIDQPDWRPALQRLLAEMPNATCELPR